MPPRPSVALLLLGLPLLLAGCTHELNQIRENRFANPPLQAVEVQPQALSLTLVATPNGQSFTAESLDKLNHLLVQQGRLANQSVTLIPHTPAGERIATRLAQVLRERGLPNQQLNLEALRLQKGQDDVMVVSQALVVRVPKCVISAPDRWTIAPYASLGGLGCANEANIAAMVSDPRDLITPRTLDAGDGIQANGAVQRYHENDLPELVDIDFSKK